MNGRDEQSETRDLKAPAECSPSDWQSDLMSCYSIRKKTGFLRALWLRCKDMARAFRSWRSRRAYRKYLLSHPEFAQFVRTNREILETVDRGDSRYH